MKELFDAMKEYDTIRRNALETYEQEKKKIQADYGDSRVGQQKLMEAVNIRDSVISEAKKKGRNFAEQVFSELSAKVESFVAAPVPADFPAVLEAIKVTGKNLSPAEADAYMNRYGGNYTAYRSLASLYGSLGVCRVYPVTYDGILYDISKFRSLAINFFSSAGNYMYRLLLHDENPMQSFFQNISSFLNGNILEYGRSISEESEE